MCNQFHTDRLILRRLSQPITRHPEAQGVKRRSGRVSTWMQPIVIHVSYRQLEQMVGCSVLSFHSENMPKGNNAFSSENRAEAPFLKASLIFSGAGWSQLLVATAPASFFFWRFSLLRLFCVGFSFVISNFYKVKNYAAYLKISPLWGKWTFSHSSFATEYQCVFSFLKSNWTYSALEWTYVPESSEMLSRFRWNSLEMAHLIRADLFRFQSMNIILTVGPLRFCHQHKNISPPL